MTYQVSCTGSGSASISGNTLNIVAGNTSGTMTVTIQPMIDGIRVGKAKVITIEVQGSASANNGATGTGGVNNGGIENSETLEKYSTKHISSEYDEDDDEAGIQYDGHSSLKGAKDSAIKNVENFLNELRVKLQQEGFSSSEIESAISTTLAYFTSLINALDDYQQNNEGLKTCIFNANGGYQQFEYNFVESMKYSDALNEAIAGSASVTVLQNTGMFDNQFAIIIESAYVVAKFKEFFNNAQVEATGNTGKAEGTGSRTDIDNSQYLKNKQTEHVTSEYDEDNDEVGIQYDGHDTLKGAKDSAIQNVENFLNELRVKLLQEGFSSSEIESAISTTLAYFTSLINGLKTHHE